MKYSTKQAIWTAISYFFLILFCILLMILIAGCSTKKETTERTKLIITENEKEKKTEVQCFCPEQKKEGTANVISAVGNVAGGLIEAIF